jgi:hypothetical protein
MNISYRTRQLIRRILSAALTVAVVLFVVALCLILWLQRFVVYTDQGAKLVFDRSGNLPQSQLPQPPEIPSVTIHFRDDPFREGLQQLNGYHIDPKDLMNDPDAVRNRLENLPAGTPVLLDVKGYRGYFYYSTRVGLTTSSSYDMSKMDDFIRWLAGSDLYVIARMSALRDFDLVWHDESYGLTKTSGGLYSDRGSYGLGYWLNPTNTDVLKYLTAVIKELDGLGFDEVVLQNFCFPDVDNLSFQGNREEAILSAAQQLVDACATDSFSVSFASDDPAFILPEGLCRLYLEGVSPENAQTAWDSTAIADKRLYLVFVAPNENARYQIENGILLPLP